MSSLSLLSPSKYYYSDVYSWFNNIPKELNVFRDSGEDVSAFNAYYSEAGLLSSYRRPFFMAHYARSFALAIRFIRGDDSLHGKTILDLGCGFGTQSLAFALMGARVISVDSDPESLRFFRRRIELYQSYAGRLLDIQPVLCNTFDLGSIVEDGSVDVVFSLFAFNMMQPSSLLLQILHPLMAPASRFCIIDGNNLSLLQAIDPSRRRHVLTPLQLDSHLRGMSFSCHELGGLISLPPLLWRILPCRVCSVIDSFLSSSHWLFPVSYMACYRQVV